MEKPTGLCWSLMECVQYVGTGASHVTENGELQFPIM